nr:PAS domain-containing protein [Sphingomonas sp.]
MLGRQDPEQILDTALHALSRDSNWKPVLDKLPAPIYVTDSRGSVTYWNRACVEFAGREPRLGRDRWCVTWQLFTTTGEPLPHEDCPMAQAIRKKTVVRDAIAIAERPDGTRRAFRPYPTPLFNDDGSLRGAVNMLIDVTEEQSEALHQQAERCRRLALAMYDRGTSSVLGSMAEGFERTAAKLCADNDS